MQSIEGDEAKRYKAVRLDTFQAVEGELISANVDTGFVVVRRKDPEGNPTSVDVPLMPHGIAIVARMLLLCAVIGLGLSACSSTGNLSMFIEADLQNSIAVNTAAGNTAGAQCSTALLPVAMASPNPTQDGLFTLLARKMAAEQALKSPACGPIVAQILLNATHAVPILGNVIGTLGF